VTHIEHHLFSAQTLSAPDKRSALAEYNHIPVLAIRYCLQSLLYPWPLGLRHSCWIEVIPQHPASKITIISYPVFSDDNTKCDD
jgi:hypothetical protein